MARFATSQTSLNQAIDTLADKADFSAARPVTALAAVLTSSPTAAQFVNGVLTTAGGTTNTLTTPTAAAIVAAIPDCQVGYSFEVIISNQNSGTLTLSAGASVTLPAVATVLTTVTRIVKGVVTNVGTPAVQLY
jgi:hypothetical protein